MKSVVFEETEKIKLVDRPVPERSDGEVLVKIKYVGICGSDYHSYKGSNPFVSYPYTPGHESSAEVVEADTDSVLEAGDTVVIDPVLSCGACYPCSVGRPNVCENLRVIGASAEGLMQEYAVLPEKNVHKAPEGLTSLDLVFTEPLSIGAQANFRAGVEKNELVTVIGAGTIGIAGLLIARWTSDVKSLVVEPNITRREIVEDMGADVTVDPTEDSVTEVLEREFSRKSSPVVIEAVGTEGTINLALDTVSSAGRVVVQGIVGEKITIDSDVLIEKEIDLLGSRLSTNQFPNVVKLMGENVEELRRIPKKGFPVDDIEDAFACYESRKDLMKVYLEFD